MSKRNYQAAAGEKTLITFPGAEHGLSYLADPARYRDVVMDFVGACLNRPA